MRLIVCGSRDWMDPNSIYEVLKAFPQGTIVIHGANGGRKQLPDGSICLKGADLIAGRLARKLGFLVVACPAERHTYGKLAGPLRNTFMLTHSPDVVLAFHNHLAASRGTKNMIDQAVEQNVPVLLYGFVDGKLQCAKITQADYRSPEPDGGAPVPEVI